MCKKNQIDLTQFISELKFRTSASSGPGGQHVNRTNSRVEAVFNIEDSEILSPEQKLRLNSKLQSKITNMGELIVAAQDTRSQNKNKELATERMLNLISEALRERKKRIPTKKTKSAIEKRLETKKQVGEKKKRRKKPGVD